MASFWNRPVKMDDTSAPADFAAIAAEKIVTAFTEPGCPTIPSRIEFATKRIRESYGEYDLLCAKCPCLLKRAGTAYCHTCCKDYPRGTHIFDECETTSVQRKRWGEILEKANSLRSEIVSRRADDPWEPRRSRLELELDKLIDQLKARI